jgi:hypothetical protein
LANADSPYERPGFLECLLAKRERAGWYSYRK